MAETCFLDELKKLKMSSKEAVDNIEDFSEFKQYMHVERVIEKELKGILDDAIRASMGRLILVCGSAGDGKSHLLSYLLNKYPKLNDVIEVHNDATESFDPKKTSLETLNKELEEYNDENIDNSETIKVLLINLGTLTNFIDSEYGENFSRLKDYIENNQILMVDVINKIEIKNNKFSYVNFADYHMFSLNDDGVGCEYIYELMDKVFAKVESNRFYTEYRDKCSICHVRKRCPIKENFELLSKDEVKKGVSYKLIEIMIKEKVSITTRSILNFIYDIIVYPDFNSLTREKFLKKIDRLNIIEYMEALTANIMFTNKDSSRIIKALSNVDPVLCSNEDMDDLINRLNREPYFARKYLEKVYPLDNTYVVDVLNDEAELKRIFTNSKINRQQLQKWLINHYLRLDYLCNSHTELYTDPVYSEFIKYLYYFNTNNIAELGALYDSVSEAIYKLDNAKSSDNNIRINMGKSQNRFKIYEKLYLECNEDESENKVLTGRLDKFVSNIILDFVIKNRVDRLTVKLDYKLYNLLTKVRQGYIPKKKERNDFISFIDSIEDIKNYGEQNKEIYIKENIADGVETFKFTKKFGKYKFERIK
ncbi:MAG: DNA phosphorothioation-dependent restriction protein DptF [Clostridium sp.]|uniref:DNA phosphorothioation-dependent restriction protein DptF n=1 Tax=Clostridium sp. TaxID=1506 RepID=UPI0025BCD9BD|nr:DNA phosphorothioation-dependent restriction protein DptF [Clostridium sp.]MCF0149308.1 DNA phosphorothioation-dependent restriction protein DptF [Clostridium sp.]